MYVDLAPCSRLAAPCVPSVHLQRKYHTVFGCNGTRGAASTHRRSRTSDTSDEYREVFPEAKWRLALHEAAAEHALTKTALTAQTREIYRAYVLEERPIGEVAARFGVTKNYIGLIKLRVGRMIAALEAEYGD